MFSWQTTIETTSLRLSQPSSPSAQYEARLSSRNRTGASESEFAPEQLPDLHDEVLLQALSGEANVGYDEEDTDAYVLDVVISDTNLGTGFRGSGQGIALEGSFHAIYASALDGSKIFSINPTSLWGMAEGKWNEDGRDLDVPEGKMASYGSDGDGAFCSSRS